MGLARSGSMAGPSLAAALPGSGAWKEMALAAIEANTNKGCLAARDMKATPRFTAAMASLRSEDVEMVASKEAAIRSSKSKLTVRAAKKAPVTKDVDDRVGAFPPIGYWDPFGLAAQTSEGTVAYFREAELKHGRVCMLASVGFIVGEKFHPLFGGDVDVPPLYAVTDTDLALFWPAILAVTGGIELATSKGRTESTDSQGFSPELKADVTPGDIGFDPLGLKSSYSDEQSLTIQNQELAHGRWAMITTLGMLLQELIVPQKLYGA